MKKPRAGCQIYKGLEIPAGVKIYTSKLGREFYFSATNEFGSIIRFIDDGSFLTIPQHTARGILEGFNQKHQA